ncbi:hypothetical protein SAMN05216227_102054 [Pseudorhodobacter antarcticus]|uniref:Uncharacterized protein n=1 Tax=Pseudorhodobacter antarcticus TaxID=1077947 RepID=A0A1H8IJ44_9RHOB|nr:hypothetical protein SAMN05216227_102054 [Pseudorhodobacter antarcticus]
MPAPVQLSADFLYLLRFIARNATAHAEQERTQLEAVFTPKA